MQGTRFPHGTKITPEEEGGVCALRVGDAVVFGPGGNEGIGLGEALLVRAEVLLCEGGVGEHYGGDVFDEGAGRALEGDGADRGEEGRVGLAEYAAEAEAVGVEVFGEAPEEVDLGGG